MTNDDCLSVKFEFDLISIICPCSKNFR